MIMIVSRAAWDEFLTLHPGAHFLQSGTWGDLKSQFGWEVVRLIKGTAGAQILFKSLPLGYSIAYLPKGPVGEDKEIYSEIECVCRERRAIFIKIEPDHFDDDLNKLQLPPDFQPARSIQPRRTVVISLDGSEEEILSRMKQKTRYNIRLAEKKEVVVKPSNDVGEFYQMAQATARRDAFGVHHRSYYQAVFDLFHQDGSCELLTAYYGERALASMFVLSKGENAYYLYGASYEFERNRMPTYLIQWEAMKWAKRRGCRFYDLWGIPDLDEEQLEDQFKVKHSHDGLWGVYRFKRGFGGEVRRSVGAWDRVYQPGWYQAYSIYLRVRGAQGE